MQNEHTHTSKNIGSGHRIAGTAALLWYKVMTDKYVRYLGFLDGLVRFIAISKDEINVTFVTSYLKEFSDRVKNNLGVDDLSPAKYLNGKHKNLFAQINEKNKTHEARDNPFNFFNILANDTQKKNYLTFRNSYLPFMIFKNHMKNVYADYKTDVRVYDDKINTALEEHHSTKDQKNVKDVGSDWKNTVSTFISGKFVKFTVPNLSKETIVNLNIAKKEHGPLGAMIYVKDVFRIDESVIRAFSTDLVLDRYHTVLSLPLAIPRCIERISISEKRINNTYLDQKSFVERTKSYNMSNAISVGGVCTNLDKTPKELLESPFYDSEMNIVSMRKFADFSLKIQKKQKRTECYQCSDLNCFGKNVQLDYLEKIFDIPITCTLSGYYDLVGKKFVACFMDEMNGQPVALTIGDKCLKENEAAIPYSFHIPEISDSDKFLYEKMLKSTDLYMCDGKKKFKMRSYSTVLTTDIVGFICWYYRQNSSNSCFTGLKKKESLECNGLEDLLQYLANFGIHKFQTLHTDEYIAQVEQLRASFTLNCGNLNGKHFMAYFDNRFSPPHLIGVRVRDDNKQEQTVRGKFSNDQTFPSQISKYFFDYRRHKNKVLRLDPDTLYPTEIIGTSGEEHVTTYLYEDHLFVHDPTTIFSKKKHIFAHFPASVLNTTDEMHTDGHIDYGNFLKLLDYISDTKHLSKLYLDDNSGFVTEDSSKYIFQQFYTVKPSDIEEKILIDQDF